MSKELEALEALDKLCDLATCGDLHFHAKHNVWTRLEGVNKYKPAIETALKDKEKQDNILQKSVKISLVKSQYGDILVYINDYRVIGSSHSGLGKVVDEIEIPLINLKIGV